MFATSRQRRGADPDLNVSVGGVRSWFLLGAVTVVGSLWQAACGPAPASKFSGGIAQEMLLAVGPEVVSPAIEEMQSALLELDASVAAWSDATAAGENAAESRQRAQDAWREAVSAWQVLEVMQIGPAGSALTVVGGQDLRDEVYSWPTTNPCRVDQVTVSGAYADSDFFESSLVNAYGLDALEHLLFSSGEDNACPGQVDINADGSWEALEPAALNAARAAYATVVVGGITSRLEQLQRAWDPDGGHYTGKLAATDGESPYDSTQQAVEAVFGSLFYLETVTKDEKLAVPLGLRGCVDTVCPEAVEFVTSAHSVRAIEANLDGFRRLFTGGDGVGLDDCLVELGHEALALQTLERVDTASALAAGLTGSLQDAVVERPEEVLALHDELTELSRLLKGDLSTVLRLQVPAEAAGDND